MNNSHFQPAHKYFDFLAKMFPVMCASDEFHFLPRAEAACGCYDRFDSLEKDRIEEALFEVKQFKNHFNRLAAHDSCDPETAIDLAVLNANISGIEIEFEQNKTFCHNPLLYLKVIFIGLDHALTKPAPVPEERQDRFFRRLSAVPGLMLQARENITSVPMSYYHAAFFMLQDGREYLADTMKQLSEISEENMAEGRLRHFQNCFDSLDKFEKYLSSLSPMPDGRFAGASIGDSMGNHFLSARSLDEIFDIAVQEWHDTLEHLQTLKSLIHPEKTWQGVYHSYTPENIDKLDVIALYRQEVENLRHFFMLRDFTKDDLSAPMAVIETPTYLRSVRGSASFAAALRSDEKEKSFFYITTQLCRANSKEASSLHRRLHQEYQFLTAHETFPGHHLLDTVRRRLKNPVRRQIESPLFYEGWASYAESILTEYGYADRPEAVLVDYKRRLWRSARCQIDVGLSTGKMDRETAGRLLIFAGFSQEEAKRQIDRFKLNPGYQVCYTLGRYEIMKLKETYLKRVGGEGFHAFLLEGGELPFHLIENRLSDLGPAD